MTPFSPAMGVHLAATLAALPLGAVMLARTKGDGPHRLAGRVWVALMAVAAVSSFWLPAFGKLSWIHALSVVILVSLTGAILGIRTGNVRMHQRFMAGAMLGLAGAFIGALAPHRYLGSLLWG